MGYLGRVIVEQARMFAFRDAYLVLAVGFLIAAVSALALVGKPQAAARTVPARA